MSARQRNNTDGLSSVKRYSSNGTVMYLAIFNGGNFSSWHMKNRLVVFE